MRTIYKFPLKPVRQQKIKVPIGAKALCVHWQDDVLCLWVEVETIRLERDRYVWLVGTGSDMVHVTKDAKYINTVFFPNGDVAHICVDKRLR